MAKFQPHDTTAIELSQLAGALGAWLLQWFVLIPGLLPILALTVVFALPLVVLGLIPVLLLVIPYAIWRAAWAALRALRRVRGARAAGPPRARSPLPATASTGPE